MKMRTLSLILLIFALMLPFSANADQLYLNGVNGTTDPTGAVFIDPYYGGFSSTANNNIYCVDPDHDSYIGTNWTVNVTPLTSSLANTYLGANLGASALKLYEEMAYLIFYTNFGKPGESTSEQQAIQTAIWHILGRIIV